MSKQVEQTLTGLIPTLTSTLPRELVQLALSLLAQSRSKASSLKAEEEIARTYACAHLACERLKQSLNLPPIEPRPPCPPRVYKKVYNYFNTAIPAKTSNRVVDNDAAGLVNVTSPSAPRTPSKRKTDGVQSTPTKPVTSSTKARQSKLQAASSNDEAPEWVMPAIRQVCKALGAPAAAPHIYAGVCSVSKIQSPEKVSVAQKNKRTRGVAARQSSSSHQLIQESQLPALIVAIAIYTLPRLSGEETSPDAYVSQRERAISTLAAIDTGTDTTMEDIIKDLEQFLREAQNGWLDLPWYQNIPEGAGLDPENHEDSPEGENDEDDPTATPKRSKLPKRAAPANRASGASFNAFRGGLGTMMQDRVDYLSDARRADYVTWKADIMDRIQSIESEQQSLKNTVTG